MLTNRRATFRRRWMIWTVCFWATAAIAADDSSTSTRSESVVYETATVRARPLDSATAAVTILDREAIESLDVSSLAELMRFVPGIEVVSNGPRGGLSFAQIRGGDPNFTIVLLDGVPLNDTTDQFGGAVNLNSMPTVHIERIEVVRGPVSSSYGSAGLAGVINVITRRGGDSKMVEPSFRVAAGDNSVLQGAASFSGGDDRRDYFVALSWEQEEDRVVEDEFEQLVFQGNARLPLGDHASMRVTGRLTGWEGEDYPEASGGPVFGSGETRHSDHDETSIGLEWEIGKPAQPHRIYTTFYRHDLDRESPEVSDPGNPFAFVPASTESTTFTRWNLGWSYPVVSGKLNVDVGLEAGQEDGKNDSTRFLPGPVDGSYRLDRNSGGAFVELVTQRGRALFELSARIDFSEGFDTEFNPRGGLSYRFDSGTRLSATIGRAFKLPSFFVLGSPADLGGNPDLEPETSVGGDVGIEHPFAASRLTTSLRLFYFEFQELIDFVFDPRGFVNRSAVESSGAELSVGWNPSERIALQTNLTRQDVEDSETGEVLRHRPEWIATARFDWSISGRLRWELDGQWLSERVDQQITAPSRDSVAGYQLFGSALSYRLSPDWGIRARIDNLTDKEYETLIGFPGPDRGFRVGLSYRPGRAG